VVYTSLLPGASSHFHSGLLRGGPAPHPVEGEDHRSHGYVEGARSRAHGNGNQPIAGFLREPPEPRPLRAETEGHVAGNIDAVKAFAFHGGPEDPEAGFLRLRDETGRVDDPAHLHALQRSGRGLRDGLIEPGGMTLGEDDRGPRGRGGPQNRPQVAGIGHLVEKQDAAVPLLPREALLHGVVFALRDARRDSVVRAARGTVELLLRDDADGNALPPRQLLDFRGTRVLAAALHEKRLDGARPPLEHLAHRVEAGDDHSASSPATRPSDHLRLPPGARGARAAAALRRGASRAARTTESRRASRSANTTPWRSASRGRRGTAASCFSTR